MKTREIRNHLFHQAMASTDKCLVKAIADSFEDEGWKESANALRIYARSLNVGMEMEFCYEPG